jgi:hypothetical protein
VLTPPDSIHLRAAQGWLELGNPVEATGELEKIRADLRACPEVLEVEWNLNAQAKKWNMCLEIAEELIRTQPGEPVGWIHRSFSLHELKLTQKAWDTLLSAALRFPKNWVIPYSLACYACQLGNLEESRQWLIKAFEIGDEREVKLKALDDPDLQLLWENIGERK